MGLRKEPVFWIPGGMGIEPLKPVGEPDAANSRIRFDVRLGELCGHRSLHRFLGGEAQPVASAARDGSAPGRASRYCGRGRYAHLAARLQVIAQPRRGNRPHFLFYGPLLSGDGLVQQGSDPRQCRAASRLGGDKLGVERAGQARDDFVLHVEEIGQRLVKPLGPEMIAGFGGASLSSASTTCYLPRDVRVAWPISPPGTPQQAWSVGPVKSVQSVIHPPRNLFRVEDRPQEIGRLVVDGLALAMPDRTPWRLRPLVCQGLGFVGTILTRERQRGLNLRIGRRPASRTPCDADGIAHNVLALGFAKFERKAATRRTCRG